MKKFTILVLTLILLLFTVPEAKAGIFTNEFTTPIDSIISDKYEQILASWYEEGLRDDMSFSHIISPTDFIFDQNEGLLQNDQNYDDYLNAYEKPNLSEGQVFTFVNKEDFNQTIQMNFEVEQTGLYKIGLDYFSETTSIGDIEISVLINGKEPFYEASQIVLPTYWETPNTFTQDRYGNDIMPNATQKHIWEKYDLRDSQRLYEQALLFKLNEGSNTIEIVKRSGAFKLGQVYIQNYETFQSYETYLSKYENMTKHKTNLIELQAEALTLKNDISIRFSTDRNPKNTPNALIENKLNVIDGTTYDVSGQTIYYDVNVEVEGLYKITLKSKQDKQFTNSFRTIKINGEVPFDEARNVKFYASNWINKTLSGEGGNYWFYLKSGVNTLSIEVNAAPYRDIYQKVNYVMSKVNELALEIKKLTGNQIDENRDWEITEYLPNLESDLRTYATLIETAYNDFKQISTTDKDGDIASGLKSAYGWLNDLANDPNSVPSNLGRLTGATASVLQRLGIVLPLIINAPLTLDTLYVHGEDVSLPEAGPNFFESIWYEITRFFASFFNSQTGLSKYDGELTVWVNRSRQYVNLMQQISDAEFTTKTGIKVNISLMPDESKLILATSSNTQPDLAMGIAGWRPYDFAIRNAVVDMTEFEDFREVTERFNPGAFMQLIYQDGVYGLPETQNFNVLFYRKDILNSLSLEVPDTWDDVIYSLPELQRYGMNFYSMLSGASAFKSFSTTMPYIMQQGGQLYEENVLSTALDSKEAIDAMTLMTDLYTVYALPLEVGSFYNQFRYGNMPMGIGDFGMYIQLLFAAPEIAGLWDIAPLPGILKDGVVDRSYDGASTSSMIFKNSKMQDEAWDFLRWWMEAETQLTYANNLLTAYGPEYMWNTANVEAFSLMNMNRQHKQVFLDQWEHVLDTAKTPASYMLERELSNAWNRIVYDGINVRTAMEDAEVVVNKEVFRKMLEFNFINSNGDIVKPYLLPTKETLDRWVNVND